MSADATHPREPCAHRNEGMPAEGEAQHRLGRKATAEAVALPDQTGIAGEATAQRKGMDQNAECFKLRAQIGGLRLQTKQLNMNALLLPMASQLQGQLGAAFCHK